MNQLAALAQQLGQVSEPQQQIPAATMQANTSAIGEAIQTTDTRNNAVTISQPVAEQKPANQYFFETMLKAARKAFNSHDLDNVEALNTVTKVEDLVSNNIIDTVNASKQTFGNNVRAYANVLINEATKLGNNPHNPAELVKLADDFIEAIGTHTNDDVARSAANDLVTLTDPQAAYTAEIPGKSNPESELFHEQRRATANQILDRVIQKNPDAIIRAAVKGEYRASNTDVPRAVELITKALSSSTNIQRSLGVLASEVASFESEYTQANKKSLSTIQAIGSILDKLSQALSQTNPQAATFAQQISQNIVTPITTKLQTKLDAGKAETAVSVENQNQAVTPVLPQLSSPEIVPNQTQATQQAQTFSTTPTPQQPFVINTTAI